MMQAVLFLAALVVLLAAFTDFASWRDCFSALFFASTRGSSPTRRRAALWICAIWALTDFLCACGCRAAICAADEPKRRARAVR